MATILEFPSTKPQIHSVRVRSNRTLTKKEKLKKSIEEFNEIFGGSELDGD